MFTNAYQIKTITSLQELDDVRVFWERFHAQPFAEYEFFKLLAERRSNVLSPCVLVLRRGGGVVSLWVGRIESEKVLVRLGYLTFAKVPVRQGVFVEGGMLGEQTEDTHRLLLDGVSGLLREQHLHMAVLENVRIGSPLHRAVLRHFNWTRICQAEDASRHWLLRPPRTWDEFLKHRNKKHRYWLKRLPAVLDRDFKDQWEIRCYRHTDQAQGFLHAAEKVARATYQRGLGVGFCGDAEHEWRVQRDARLGRLRGYILFVRDEPRAFWYCFTHQGVLHLASTGYHPAWRDYEVGTVLLMKVLQDHCGADVEVVDFGLGDAGYKERFATEHFLETSLYIFSGGAKAVALHALQQTMLLLGSFARGTVNRLGLTGRIKTRWRRSVGKRAATVDRLHTNTTSSQ